MVLKYFHKLHVIVVLIFTICKIVAVQSDIRIKEQYRILFIPVQQKSHTFMQQSIAQELQKRGHDVFTVLGTTFGKRVENDITKRGGKILWFNQANNTIEGLQYDEYMVKRFLEESNISLWKRYELLDKASAVVMEDCQQMWNDTSLIDNIKSLRFDLAFIDPWHLSPCNVLIPHNLSLQFVTGAPSLYPWMYGVPSQPSFTPNINLQLHDDMTFWQRLHNFLLSMATHNPVFFTGRDTSGIFQQYAPNEQSWNDLVNRASLSFIFRDHITEWPQPTMPNVIFLPGVSYSEPKVLPSEFKSIMDQASNGVIIVSFGSMGGYINIKHITKLMSAFKLIPNTVIFSYAGHAEHLKPIPENVHIFSWIPQNDLLGHNNTKIFITHGGHNGQIEAVYHAVPMITIPLFAEQPHNAFRVVSHSIGLSLDIETFTRDDLILAIHEIITNSTYKNYISLRSLMLKNRPGKHPAQEAADWIEYVLKYGSSCMKSTAASMPFYKLWLLDIMSFCLFLLLVVFFLFSLMIYFGCRLKPGGIIKLKRT